MATSNVARVLGILEAIDASLIIAAKYRESGDATPEERAFMIKVTEELKARADAIAAVHEPQ